MKNFELPPFMDKGKLNKYLVENEDLIIAQKKSIRKEADGFGGTFVLINDKSSKEVVKEDNDKFIDKPVLKADLAINTTNVLDSHWDLHLPGMWDESVKANKNPLHLQTHSRQFEGIISSGKDLSVRTETFTWKSLGYDFAGKTEALIYTSKIRKSRNAYMHEQYAKGFVTNHSVGMRYEKMVTCINDEDYPVQKENWDKYIEQMVNKEEAEKLGFFWAVTKASHVEGSAVPLGSNSMTPTLDVKGEPELDEFNEKEKEVIKWLSS